MSDFLDRYTEYAKELTDAPIDYHRFVGYALVSTVVGNNVWLPIGDKKLYPNLWIILLAPSSLYRKSTAIGIGVRLLNLINSKLILPAEFTQEKLLDVLQNQNHGIFVFYEFLTLMGALSKDYMAGTKAFLAEMYDSPEHYERATVMKTVTLKNVCVNILAATTVDWFLDKLKEGDLAGGFLPRFLIVPSGPKLQSMALPPEVDPMKRNSLVSELNELSRIRGKMVLQEESKRLHKEWFIKFEADAETKDGNIKAFFARLETYMLKIATLDALVTNKSLIIQPENINRAKQVINWLACHLDRIVSEEMAFTLGQKHRNKVLRIIRQTGSRGIQHSHLLRASNLDARELKAVIDTLKEQEAVKHIEQRGRTRPMTEYVAIEFYKLAGVIPNNSHIIE
jgi:predicted transcriptional regulator